MPTCSALFVLASLLMIAPALAAEDLLLKRVEGTAATLPWLSIGDVLYDRDPSLGPEAEKVASLLKELRCPSKGRSDGPGATTLPLAAVAYQDPATQSIEQYRALLSHADPKVRTLGIVLLFDLNRADVLPDIAALVNDPAITFPQPAPLAVRLHPERPWPMQQVQVSRYARAAIDCWIGASWELSEARRAGQLQYGDPEKFTDRLREFAALRDPQLNTAALRIAMQRATGGISPLQPDRVARVQQVLMKLQRISMPRRFFVALALDFERYRDEKYSPTYLLDLARQVPRDMRLATIRGQPAIDDPDLEPDVGQAYVLDHAVDLLRDRDADLILKSQPTRSATRPSDWMDARFVVAAAMLRPGQADEVLIPAFDRFAGEYDRDQRTRLAVALAELGSEQTGLPAAVDWFFREKPQPGAFGFGREMFLAQLQRSSPVRFRKTVAAIAADDRLTTLGPASTRILLTSIEGYLGRRLADDEQIRVSYGIDEFQRDRKFEHLPAWHRAIRETIGEWNQ